MGKQQEAWLDIADNVETWEMGGRGAESIGSPYSSDALVLACIGKNTCAGKLDVEIS